ncbi:MAG: diaminopimelate epimerase, partial [Lysobacterales bacterium]
MPVTFHKMHGLGNDFVLLDLREQDFHVDTDTAIGLAERHTGIGCDQVLVLNQPASKGHLAAFEIWNADGSRAEQCGNGVRCMGLYLHMRGEAPQGPFALGGPAGEITVECLGDGMVQVDMGLPRFEPTAIPLDLEPDDGWYTLDTARGRLRIGAASMGNPHALLVVEDIEGTDVAGLGAIISTHPAFPRGCNAGFAQLLGHDRILLRVFERGAGETRACGTGACAAVALLRRAGMVENTVQVTQNGGNLVISWPGGKKKV